MSDETFVIVGASLAGAKAAEGLRSASFEGEIVLIGAEDERPYERPPLSKGYLQGKAERESIYVHPRDWYGSNGVDLRLGAEVVAVDRDAHQILMADGGRLSYSKLLLTTGSSPRPLPVGGAELDGVLYLRTVADSDLIKSAIADATRIVVIGAGWIGLEAAAAAREQGVHVTLLETAELPLLRVLGREVAEVFAQLHREHEVDLRFGAEVESIIGTGGRVTGVRLADGSQIEADAVIVGIGITPNVQLGEEAGLDIDNGVKVNDRLQSSDPDIYAAGDVANAFHPLLRKHVRVEHWSNALNQPQAAARAMVGQQVSYDRVPYFFTDQYDLGMEYSGYVEPDGYDRVVFRGDVAGREFIAFWLGDGGRVLAGMNVNIWDVNDQIARLVRFARPIDPDALADPSVSLDSLASG
ncbi:MAG TPA: FAD-dependent oxidoreductase [Streptosporangiaceae bacterium]|jgi:3-phenylpropionate/trans-cinnamate dioxygenase ferredoxin reductase subunit